MISQTIIPTIAEGECILFRIKDAPNNVGPRLGGVPPEGVVPKHSHARYLMTLPFSSDEEVSIFTYFVDDAMFFNAKQLWDIDDGFVEIIRHPINRRGSSGLYASDLSSHHLALECKQKDVSEAPNNQYSSGHKMFGRPYYIKAVSRLVADIDKIIQEGFVQFVQLDFPSSMDGSISGDWPFADGLFHVFVKSTTGLLNWKYFWQY